MINGLVSGFQRMFYVAEIVFFELVTDHLNKPLGLEAVMFSWALHCNLNLITFRWNALNYSCLYVELSDSQEKYIYD